MEKDGDLGDLDNGTVYYVERGTSPTVHLHATLADALAGQSGTRISAGTGAITGQAGRLVVAGGVRDVGVVGDLDGPEIHILERADAHAFRGDNYNSASEVSRFQSGAVAMQNFYWECLRANGSDDAGRSDFDVAPGAAPTFRRGEIATLAQFNHFASSGIVIDGLRFRNRTAAAGNWVMEFTAAFTTPPKSLSLLPTGRAVSVLGVFLTDGVPLRLVGLSGLSQQSSNGFGGIEVGTFNPNGNNLTDAQADAKVIWLVDPAGSPGKRSARGIVEIRRAVRLDFGAEASATGGSCRLIPTDASPPYAADVVDDSESGPHLFPEVLHRRSAGGTTAYTDWKNYRWLKASPSYRKATGTFAVAMQTEAGQVQSISHSLTREVWPDGINYAHSTVATAATVDDVFRIIKAHELANPKDGGATASLAIINSSGYVELGPGFSLVLSATATQASAWDSDSETLTVKSAATLTASANGVRGIQATGDGTITTSGTVDTSAWLTKTATAQNALVTATAAEAGVKLTLFTATGAVVGTHTTAAGSLSATFSATAAQATAGCRLLASRPGYEPESRTLDLSAGGAFAEAFGPRTQIVQFDGTASYSAAAVSSVSTVAFGVSDLSAVTAKIDVANEQLSALGAFATFASKAHSTANGQKYLAFGGRQPVALSLFSGALLSVPAGVQVRRRAAGNSNATILATVIADGDAVVADETNGAVQFIGGVSVADFQKAILEEFDIDPVAAGTQSVAARLLALGNVASANATAIAALPTAAAIRDALLAAEVEAGGDTVKAALAGVGSSAATAVMGHAITGAHDVEKALAVMMAVLGGTATRTGDTLAFADSDGDTVIQATVGTDGSRSDVVVS